MTVRELETGRGQIGPLVQELEQQGCLLSIVEGPSMTGRLSLQVLFPDDEYVEKRCRRILDDWRTLGRR